MANMYFFSLQSAPELSLDAKLREHVSSKSGQKVPYAIIRGTVQPIGTPIASVMSPSVTGVIQVIKLKWVPSSLCRIAWPNRFSFGQRASNNARRSWFLDGTEKIIPCVVERGAIQNCQWRCRCGDCRCSLIRNLGWVDRKWHSLRIESKLDNFIPFARYGYRSRQLWTIGIVVLRSPIWFFLGRTTTWISNHWGNFAWWQFCHGRRWIGSGR